MAKHIALAGKGGTGKSTIAALLIRLLCSEGKGPILAVDADPDSNLGALLGITPKKTLGELREESLHELKNLPAGMTKANYFELGLHDIIEESSCFDLLTMGRGEGTGCYCYLNNLIKKFIDDLGPSYSWIVMDNEAGLEHISRRTTANIDTLIVVVTGTPLSYNCAKSIEAIIYKLKSRINKKYIVTNMISDNNRKKTIKDKLADLDMEYICDIPYEPELEDILFGRNPIESLKGSTVLDSITYILKKITQ